MPRLRSPIHKPDIAPAWKYAQAIGIPNPSIKIDRQGTVTIIPGKPDEVGQIRPLGKLLDESSQGPVK